MLITTQEYSKYQFLIDVLQACSTELQYASHHYHIENAKELAKFAALGSALLQIELKENLC
jgi:hypothetical protein